MKKPTHVRQYGSKKILDYSSKALYEELNSQLQWKDGNKSSTVKLLDKNYDRDFKIGFLRGLLDTDGYLAPECRKYTLTSISRDLIFDSVGILDELGIENRKREYEDERNNREKLYFLEVSGNSAVDLNEQIEPRNPKRKCKLARL